MLRLWSWSYSVRRFTGRCALSPRADHQHYRELARRIDVFKTWRSTFATQHARYLRVRAFKKTFLHLEAIDVQR